MFFRRDYIPQFIVYKLDCMYFLCIRSSKHTATIKQLHPLRIVTCKIVLDCNSKYLHY